MKKNTLKKYAVLLLLFFIASGFLFSQDSFSQLREPSLADRGIAEKNFASVFYHIIEGHTMKRLFSLKKRSPFCRKSILSWIGLRSLIIKVV